MQWPYLENIYYNKKKKSLIFTWIITNFITSLNMWPTGNGPVSGKHGPLVGAIDQGTSSTRFLVSMASLPYLS